MEEIILIIFFNEIFVVVVNYYFYCYSLKLKLRRIMAAGSAGIHMLS